MATLGTNVMTLADWVKMRKPGGGIAEIIELQNNSAGIRFIDPCSPAHMHKRSHADPPAFFLFMFFLPILNESRALEFVEIAFNGFLLPCLIHGFNASYSTQLIQL